MRVPDQSVERFALGASKSNILISTNCPPRHYWCHGSPRIRRDRQPIDILPPSSPSIPFTRRLFIISLQLAIPTRDAGTLLPLSKRMQALPAFIRKPFLSFAAHCLHRIRSAMPSHAGIRQANAATASRVAVTTAKIAVIERLRFIEHGADQLPCRLRYPSQPKNQPNKRRLHTVSQNQAEHLFAAGLQARCECRFRSCAGQRDRRECPTARRAARISATEPRRQLLTWR